MTEETTPTPGQIAYETCMRTMFPETPQHAALAWRFVETKDRAAWEAAAQAVLEAFVSSTRPVPLTKETQS